MGDASSESRAPRPLHPAPNSFVGEGRDTFLHGQSVGGDSPLPLPVVVGLRGTLGQRIDHHLFEVRPLSNLVEEVIQAQVRVLG